MKHFILNVNTAYIELLEGDVKAAMMLAVAVEWQKRTDDKSVTKEMGQVFWSMTHDDWKFLGFGSRKSQLRIRRKLIDLGVLEEKNKGYPSIKQFNINLDILSERIGGLK